MGAAAVATRRRVLDMAEQCLDAVNAANAAVDDLAADHARLHTTLGAEVQRLEQRISAVSAWCEKNEQAINAHAKDILNVESNVAYLYGEGLVATKSAAFDALTRTPIRRGGDRTV